LTPRQLLVNPGFDSGNAPWVESTLSNNSLITIDTSFTLKAQTPSYFAWLGGYDNARDDLTQRVTVPAEATSMTLSFYYAVIPLGSTGGANDILSVSYQAGNGTPVQLTTFNGNTPVSTWTRFTTGLPASLAGQSVMVDFLATTDSSSATNFVIDSVSFVVNACPP
jgi:hypothetical protein